MLTIWGCPCVQSSLVLLEEGVCYDQCILLARLYEPLPSFILYSKAKFAAVYGVAQSWTRLKRLSSSSSSSQVFLTSYFCIPVSYNEKDIFWGVLVLKGLVGFHRSVQPQVLQLYWLGHRLGLPWYWIVCFENEHSSFCNFWDCIQVLHFGLLLTISATPFLLRDFCPQK